MVPFVGLESEGINDTYKGKEKHQSRVPDQEAVGRWLECGARRDPNLEWGLRGTRHAAQAGRRAGSQHRCWV